MIASRMVLAGLVAALTLAPALASDNSKSHVNKDELDSSQQQLADAQDQWNHTYALLGYAVTAANQMVSLAQSELDFAQATLQMIQQGLLHGTADDGTPGWGWVAVQLGQQYTMVPMDEGGPGLPTLRGGAYSTQLLNMQGLLSWAQYMPSQLGTNNIVAQAEIGLNLTQNYVQNVLNKMQLKPSTVGPNMWEPVGPTDNPETNQLGYYLSNPDPSTNVVDYNLATQALAYWTQIVQVDQIILQRAQAAVAQANQQLNDFLNANPPPNGTKVSSNQTDEEGPSTDASDPSNLANASVDGGGGADSGDD